MSGQIGAEPHRRSRSRRNPSVSRSQSGVALGFFFWTHPSGPAYLSLAVSTCSPGQARPDVPQSRIPTGLGQIHKMSVGQFLNSVLRPLGVRLVRTEVEASQRPGNRYALEPENLEGLDRETRKVLNLLNYTKEVARSYNAQSCDSAYHTVQLGDFTFRGQRNPAERLADIPFDFSDATVLDIGCNQGGMLFELADQIRQGIGIDHDFRMVNAANRLRSYRTLTNVSFFVFDLEKERLEFIDNLLPPERVDIVFLLSVCMWVKNWRDVIAKARSFSDNMLFESNGTEEQQLEQENALKLQYGEVKLLRSSSPDDSRQKARKLYLCRA